MKRSDFLKKLGIGAVAVVVAPTAIASIPTRKFTVRYLDAPILLPLTPSIQGAGRCGTWIPIPKGCSAKEVANFYKEHGMGLYRKDYVVSEIKKSRKKL
jgi:hypothetical protein